MGMVSVGRLLLQGSDRLDRDDDGGVGKGFSIAVAPRVVSTLGASRERGEDEQYFCM